MVFRDTDAGRAGSDYREVIQGALATAKVLVAVVGPDWLKVADENGRLIHQESDWVRKELETALRRNITVLPVLVNGTDRGEARMPRRHELPSCIESLATRQAISIDQRKLNNGLKQVSAEIRRKGKVQSWWRRGVRRGMSSLVSAAVFFLPLPAPLSGSHYFGNPAAIDPCTFAYPAEYALSDVGSGHVDPHADNFNKCDLLIDPSNGQSEVDIKFAVELPNSQDSDPASTVQNGSVTVKTYDGSDCDRVLSQTNQYELNISTRSDSLRNPSLCHVVDTATNAVVEFLNRGEKFRLRDPNDRKSLIHFDACDLLDVPTLTHLELARAGEPDLWKWLCRWSSEGDLDVSLRFDQGRTEMLKLESFGRFTGYLKPKGDDANGDNCLAVIQFRQLSPAGQEYEMVRVAVYGERPLEAVCDVARQLAQDAAMNLK
jgi:hypothetical protein